MKHIYIILIMVITLAACDRPEARGAAADNATTPGCSDACVAANTSSAMSCKLTTPELQKRKETVLASLKARISGKRELPDGYAFKFPGTDEVLDDLTEFIKTERACCDFFTFGLSVSGDKRYHNCT